ncbi:MAG: hypothetical protein AVDCRST_MAG64-4398 [uncultured Phycisphaerae bacterium]|uniref:SGNH/GDSL hydrolase family protein n=1 Tax=uncultured Phycisphaerae bacterium TaxID=904963 RepID=A0A6J4QQD5_9BACT|nr:MAG: hypothetical protein AVDCRST_MAG64-4398 [uncultured Phycisphaerae bacterium]
MQTLARALSCVLAVAFLACPGAGGRAAPAARPAEGEHDGDKQALRVYHIGNSVTDTIRYPALKEMVASAGDTYAYGRHMIPGAPLEWIFKHPDSGFKEETGYYPEALRDHAWDVLTLQPFDRQLTSDDGTGDLEVATKLIDLALPKSPGLRVYVYQRWPRRLGDEKKGYTLDYAGQWAKKYTRGWDGTNETRDYFERLTRALRDARPALEHPVQLVPVGDVLLELDRRMKAGQVPGFKGVEELYHDGIHFNNVGSFVVGTTFLATLYRQDPAGSDPAAYAVKKESHDGDISAELAKAIQACAWDVVREHPLAGVAEE